jgi:hypothetical protein
VRSVWRDNLRIIRGVSGRPLSKRLALLVDLEVRLLQMLHDSLAQLPAGFVRRLLAQDAAQQLPASREREPDPEHELAAKRIHGRERSCGQEQTRTRYPPVTCDLLHRDRSGDPILLEKDGQLLRLLSVHLKSGCHGGSLENPTDPDCVTLAAQRAPLEAWIDEAAQDVVPFMILGDFNRRIDRFGQDDHLWREIDDGDPPGLDLRRLPFNREAECSPSFPQPIDFLLFDDRAWQMVDEASFQEITYDTEDQDLERGTPSDHIRSASCAHGTKCLRSLAARHPPRPPRPARAWLPS